MKKTVLVLGIAGTLTLSGLSQAGTLSDADKDFLFGSQSVQAKTISVEEMKNTDGEYWWIGAIYGFRIGYTIYRTYRTFKYYNSLSKAFRMGRHAWRSTRNYKTWSYNSNRYGRFARSITWYNSRGQRWFTIDFHKVSNKPWYYRFHYHRRPGIKWHRPWEKGW